MAWLSIKRYSTTYRGPTLFATGALLAALAAFTTPSIANDYAEQRAAAVERCRAIDPKEYHTGLIMNPEG